MPHRLKRLPFEDAKIDDKALERAMDAMEERGIDTSAAKDEDPGRKAEPVELNLPKNKSDEGKKA